MSFLVRTCQGSVVRYFDEKEMQELNEKQTEQELESEISKKTESLDVSEDMLELKRTIEILEDQVAKLNRQIMDKDKNNANNKKNLEDNRRKLDKAQKEVDRLKKEFSGLKNRYNSLEGQYKKATVTITQKELELANLELTTRETIAAKNQLRESYDEQSAIFDSMENHKKIVDAVLEIIANKRSTIYKIVKELKKVGLKPSFKDIILAIQELKATYEIDDSILINFEKSYFIKRKIPVNNKVFNVSVTKNIYEFIVASDTHICRLTGYEIAAFDKIYDYMFNNNINTLVDLGDFLDYGYLKNSSRDNRMRYNNEILNSIITSFPYEKDIRHLIMGGNHEEIILRYGIDPLEFLELNREDFISLGHISAFLKFNNSYIGLFHPDFRLNEEKSANSMTNKLNKVINSKCDKLNINRERILMSLFGHFHIGKVLEEGLVMVPSIVHDRELNSAWHVKIYFGKNGDIENIELTKIVLGKRAKATQTYELQKKLIR